MLRHPHFAPFLPLIVPSRWLQALPSPHHYSSHCTRIPPLCLSPSLNPTFLTEMQTPGAYKAKVGDGEKKKSWSEWSLSPSTATQFELERLRFTESHIFGVGQVSPIDELVTNGDALFPRGKASDSFDALIPGSSILDLRLVRRLRSVFMSLVRRCPHFIGRGHSLIFTIFRVVMPSARTFPGDDHTPRQGRDGPEGNF